MRFGGYRLLRMHPVGGLLRLAGGSEDRTRIVLRHLEARYAA